MIRNHLERQKEATAARAGAAEWLRDLLKRKRATDRDVAANSGVSVSTVRRVLKGRTAELRTLERIAKALNAEVPVALARIAFKRRIWHGRRHVNGRLTSEFNAFQNMHRRVSDPNHPDYPRYGGVGIKICPRWENTPDGFKNFFDDMGPLPNPAYSLHRTPPTANYGPGTCVWADKRTQSIEQRGRLPVEYNGILVGRVEFERQAVADGFLCVIKRNADGSLKKTRKRGRNKRPETGSSDQE